MSSSTKTAFTLIELLIVVAIIGVLIQLALPAVEMSREAARRTQCGEQLRQMGLAMTQHVDSHGHYVTGGWGRPWVGDPDRGSGPDQPGSWAYSMLDYLEQSQLRELGKGLKGDARFNAMAELLQTPVPVFYCPSRRLPRAYPRPRNSGYLHTPGIAGDLPITTAVRGDYAANTGDWGNGQAKSVSGSYDVVEAADYEWYDSTQYTGIVFGRSKVRPAQIVDGLSKTYLVGEKHLNSSMYRLGVHDGDNDSLYTGFVNDNGRSAAAVPRPDKWRINAGQDPGTVQGGSDVFGSAHPRTWQIVLCDGSLHPMSYDVDLEIHQRLANRKDGEIASAKHAK